MADSAGGRSSDRASVVGQCWFSWAPCPEDIEHRTLLVHGCLETFGLQLEHGLIPTTLGHQLLMTTQLDDSTVLEYADAVRMPHGGKPVRDQDRGDSASRLQHLVKHLSLATHVQLCSRLVQQHQSLLRAAQRTGPEQVRRAATDRRTGRFRPRSP